MIQIQTTIVGYAGKPCTLFSAYDEDAQLLVCHLDHAYMAARRKDCMVITNDPRIDRDTLFTEDDLRRSITDFFFMYQGVAYDGKSSRLTFGDKAARCNPAQAIEKDTINSSGQQYRIAESISCAQIAAMATCWYANTRYATAESILDMADKLIQVDIDNRGYSLDDYNKGIVFTI